MFLLEKWYGDVVTPQGAGAILYAARLRWGPLRLGYGATLLFDEARPSQAGTTVRRVALPQVDADGAGWANSALRTDARWRRDADPIACRLVSGPRGMIRWDCHMPRAIGRVRIGDVTLEGLGYVEQLRLTMPPAQLPFRGGVLRWGRYVSARHALVWIAWSGSDPRQWVWLDGVSQPALPRLRLHESRAIRDEPLLTTIRAPFPKLARRLGRTLDAVREHKRLSRATLENGGPDPGDTGWTIHEEVVW